MSFKRTAKDLYDLALAVTPLLVFCWALAHFDDTAYFGKCMALVGVCWLVEIAEEVRKMRRAAEKKVVVNNLYVRAGGKP